MMNRVLPAAGEFYRHFKGNLYQIIGIAKHSETGENMVVYQALYGDYSLYARPLDMFLSPVDKVKYPEAKQEYRFEQVQPGKTEPVTSSMAEEKKNGEEKTEEVATSDADEETVRPEILRFLDADGATEKLEVLRQLRRNMDEQLLTTIELSMDLLPNEKDSMERRYELVERTLEQKLRFEGGRYRFAGSGTKTRINE